MDCAPKPFVYQAPRTVKLLLPTPRPTTTVGLATLKLADRDGARADLLRALELEPALKEAEENLRRLTASEQ